MMISRQRERISSNLTSLMREHNKVVNNSPAPVPSSLALSSSSSCSPSMAGAASAAPSWSRREKLLGVSGLNPSAMSLFDFDREFIEEEVWGVLEELPLPDDPQRSSNSSSNNSRVSQPDDQQRSSSSSNSGSNNSRVADVETNNGFLGKWLAGSTPVSSRAQTPLSRIQLQEASASSPSSKPMNVPDWSKILQNPNWTRRSSATLEDQDDHSDKENDDQEWVPPHQLAAREDEARIRTSSIIAFSVLEGAGRTLKGRDQSRVRNAVWKRTGFMAV